MNHATHPSTITLLTTMAEDSDSNPDPLEALVSTNRAWPTTLGAEHIDSVVSRAGRSKSRHIRRSGRQAAMAGVAQYDGPDRQLACPVRASYRPPASHVGRLRCASPIRRRSRCAVA